MFGCNPPMQTAAAVLGQLNLALDLKLSFRFL